MSPKLAKPLHALQGLKDRLWLAEFPSSRYISGMKWLTKQEQIVLCIVIGLLLTGLLVKYYRATHPAAAVAQSAKP
jgi:hypothetical protein